MKINYTEKEVVKKIVEKVNEVDSITVDLTPEQFVAIVMLTGAVAGGSKFRAVSDTIYYKFTLLDKGHSSYFATYSLTFGTIYSTDSDCEFLKNVRDLKEILNFKDQERS